MSEQPFLPRRLSKFVSEATSLSHRQIQRAYEDDRILVQRPDESSPHTRPLSSLVFGEDRVWLDALEIRPRIPSIYALLHKPAGVISTASDPKDRECLAPWLEALGGHVHPVGRLDADTTGAILLTDDGDLTYLLLEPLFHVEKEYWLKLSGFIEEGDARLQALLDGVDIGDGKEPAAALSLRMSSQAKDWTAIRMCIDEGRHRQIRRMSRRARLYLQHLHRVRIGPVRLGKVASGALRHLDAKEVDALYEAAGGRGLPRSRAIDALVSRAKLWRGEGRPHTRLEEWLLVHEKIS